MECKVCKYPIHHLGDGGFSHTQPEGPQEVQIAWAELHRALPCWTKAEPVWKFAHCDDGNCAGEGRAYVTDYEIDGSTYRFCVDHLPIADEMPEEVEIYMPPSKPQPKPSFNPSDLPF